MCSKIIRAAGFSQCLTTNFLSPVQDARCGVQLLSAEIFSEVRKHCPSGNRYSPLAARHSLFAVVLGSAGTSPSHDFAD